MELIIVTPFYGNNHDHNQIEPDKSFVNLDLRFTLYALHYSPRKSIEKRTRRVLFQS